MGRHTVYWTFVIIMISKCLDFEEKWQVTYTPPALRARQNAIFINICRHSRQPPNKTRSYGFHKALYFSSTDIFFCVYTLNVLPAYWKLAFGIWSIQKSARGKKPYSLTRLEWEDSLWAQGGSWVWGAPKFQLKDQGWWLCQWITGIPVQFAFSELGSIQWQYICPHSKPCWW